MIQKRSLAVLAVATVAGAALQFGLPGVAHASGTFTSISLMPFPIAQAGTLAADTTVDICVQPRDSGAGVAGTVYLSFWSGLFTSPPVPGGTATVPVASLGSTTYTTTTATDPSATWATNQFATDTVTSGANTATITSNTATVLTVTAWAPSTPASGDHFTISAALTQTPEPFLTVASCVSQGAVTSINSVPVVYTTPNPSIPAHGRDVIIAADSVVDSGSGGACLGSAGTLCNNGTYVYSPVTQYVFNPAGPTIAPDGSLGAGATRTFTVTAEDINGDAVPGAFLNLSLQSAASGGGTATAQNNFSLMGGPVPRTENLNNEPSRFGADNNGAVSVTYRAASVLPATGVDTIKAQDHPMTPTAHGTDMYTYSPTALFSQGAYTAITPFRVCDTRPAGAGVSSNQCNNNSTGAGSGPITQGATRVITIDGQDGGVIPSSGVTAVVVNVTAIAPTTGTFLSLSPDGVTSRTSSLNPAAHEVLANLVEVGVSGPGKIDVFNDLGTVNVALDVEGYVSSGSPGLFNPVAPTRICDTRAVGPGIGSNQCNTGPGSHPIGAGRVLTFNVSTGGPIPTSGVAAVVFNLTAISPTVNTVLTAYAGPASNPRPTASNINLSRGEALPNRVIVPVPSGCTTNCTVNIWNSVGSVNVAVDVDGWFSAGSGTQFTAISPARVCDTRFGNINVFGCARSVVTSGNALNIDVAGVDGVPAVGDPHTPVAIVANVTAVNATTGTFITAYAGPFSLSHPTASDLNVTTGVTATNLVVVEVGSNGTINLFNDLGNINLIVDVLGYYS